MSDLNEKWKALEAELEQARDELRVEVHLAGSEIKDDWEELEKQWHQFTQQMKRAGHEASEAGEDVGSALASLGHELRKGYDRIRKAL